ncbi:MAG: hypothetical protein JWM80_2171 [Cyanobacteria bacterium RYN_339]|nr:hypothetical protein [Cyanobacteria bacterium RYN_339]
MSAFRTFSERFCATFGAEAEAREGRLHVTLPPDLAAHFGRAQLVLGFTPHDPHGELVAYGSQVFEEMMAYLGGHGRLAAVGLPVRHAPAPPPSAPGCELLAEEAVAERFQVFNFQLAFMCDERVERLFSVCLDEHGRERPEIPPLAAGGEDQGAAVAPAPSAVRAAEDKAVAAAEAWVGPLETAALARLEGIGARLVAFYEAQMREVPVRRRRGQSEEEAVAESEELRWQLRRELERKLRDETARHQLRVQVRRISQAQVERPRHVARYRLARGVVAREVAVTTDLHDGTIFWPACDRCGSAKGTYGLCEESHLACPACLGACAGCGTERCQVELAACESCQALGCPACRTPCAGGHLGCAAHLAACPGCGQALCPRCERPHGCGLDSA